jgi:outer membrane lipoprotein carrier protein
MPIRTLRFAAVALLLAAPLSGAGKTPVPDPEAPGLSVSQRFDALIERVKLEQKQLETLEADFVQEKASEFLAAPEVSRGAVSFASPDRVRWEYRTPKPISLVIHDDVMLTWYQDLGRADKVKIGRLSSQIFQYLNASSSLDALLRYFKAAVTFGKDDEPYKIELVPRFARVAKRLASMTLWVGRSHFLPVRVRYAEPNGDVTEYRLENLRINQPIPADRFVLTLPKGVEIREIDLEGGRKGATGGTPEP